MDVTIDHLKGIAIFADLETTILDKLSLGAKLRSYKSGAILIHEGDLFEEKLYTILQGRLSVSKTSPEGKETVLRQLHAGEMFAAPALFGDRKAPGTITSLENSQIITIEKATLLATIQVKPEVALQILSYFNRRIQEMHQTIHGLISERAAVRLARLIKYFAASYGTSKSDQGTQLNSKLPYKRIARMVGITYEECVRIMKKDFQDAIMYQRGGQITITDLAALEQIISGVV